MKLKKTKLNNTLTIPEDGEILFSGFYLHFDAILINIFAFQIYTYSIVSDYNWQRSCVT